MVELEAIEKPWNNAEDIRESTRQLLDAMLKGEISTQKIHAAAKLLDIAVRTLPVVEQRKHVNVLAQIRELHMDTPRLPNLNDMILDATVLEVK